MGKRPNKGSISKFTVQPLDKEQFHRLYDVLLNNCFGGNYAATARVLGISRITAKRYETEAPDNPWMNFILKEAILQSVKWLSQSMHKKARKRAVKAKAQLQRETNLQAIHDIIEWQEATHSGARQHLLKVITRAPGRMISSADFSKNSISGGYSVKSLRNAAEQLGLLKETKGFGSSKQTWYYLPGDE